MSSDWPPITEDQIRQVMGRLNKALVATSAEDRHDEVGRAVQALTRLWADVKPDFDGDALYPISTMLIEHRTEISGHMSAIDPEQMGELAADDEIDGRHASSVDDGSNVERSLRESLSRVGSDFQPDELAFLAATSKVELPIRDRLAWALQRALGADFTVSREWRRADLAVLENDGVVAQLEAKALYAFNVLQPANRLAYLNRLVADAVKMAALAASDRYLLSMLVDVRGDIRPEHTAHVVKYSSGISAGVRSAGDTVRPGARDRWLAELAATFDSTTVEVQIDAGQVWDLDVSVDLFLTGPLRPV